MALKDSFINLNKALRTTLQNVPAVVDTLIRGFDEIGDAAEAENTYSTDERVVGKWIDGSTLYEQTVDCGALPNATTKNIPFTAGLIREFKGISYPANEGLMIPIPYVNPTQNSSAVGIYADTTNIIISTYSDRTSFTKTYITVRYTKAAASRSLKENDTKNVIDDEPDVKTVEEPAEELKK